MSAPAGEAFQPTAMKSAFMALVESSWMSSAVLPIQPCIRASMAFVPACMGFTRAPCSPHVGPSKSVPSSMIRAASRSGAARSLIAADGWRSAMSSA